MSTTQTQIGELDVIALLNPVGKWPAGARGTVVHEWPTGQKLIEISNEFGETLDEIDVTDEQIRLVWKCPPDSSDD